MALNDFQCDHLMPLPFKGLKCSSEYCDTLCPGSECAHRLVCITSRRPTTMTLWASCAVHAMRSAWFPAEWLSSTTCCSRSVAPSTARKICGSESSRGCTAPTVSRSLRNPRHASSNSSLNTEYWRNFAAFSFAATFSLYCFACVSC